MSSSHSYSSFSPWGRCRARFGDELTQVRSELKRSSRTEDIKRTIAKTQTVVSICRQAGVRQECCPWGLDGWISCVYEEHRQKYVVRNKQKHAEKRRGNADRESLSETRLKRGNRSGSSGRLNRKARQGGHWRPSR